MENGAFALKEQTLHFPYYFLIRELYVILHKSYGVAAARRLAAAKSRINRWCQTSGSSEKSEKSLVTDVWQQRKIGLIAGDRWLEIK